MRKLVWIYFVLLMMEGALRKWLLKGFSEPLLIIRDPIVLLIYFQAYNSGLFPDNSRIRFLIGLGIISIPLAILAEVWILLRFFTEFGLTAYIFH